VTVTLNHGGPTHWRPIEQAAAELRQECLAGEQLIEQLFADVDRLRDELDRRAEELEDSRRRLAERGRQLAEQRKETGRLSTQFEQQQQQLADALIEVKALREQMAREHAEIADEQRERTAALEQRLREVESERDELRRQNDSLRQESPSALPESDLLTPLAAEVGQLRTQLSQTREELVAAIDRASPAVSEPANPAPQSPELAQDVLALERQRAELEAELELVRTRATELQETVGQQKRELAEQRDDLSAELKLLRQLVEQQSDLFAARIQEPERPDAGAAPRATTTNAADESAPPADPVVSSVMAQFARLQKDVAQRRKKK
jgi:chromosome segregation ATPase